MFTCRESDCALHHETTVARFADVETQVSYYCDQGHQAVARFPAADDAVWPPEDECRDE